MIKVIVFLFLIFFNISFGNAIKKTVNNNELFEYRLTQIEIKEEKLNQLEKDINKLKNDYEFKIKKLEKDKNNIDNNYKTLLENNSIIFDSFLTWLGIIITLISLVILFINFKWLDDKIETTINMKSNNKLEQLKDKMNESKIQIDLFDSRIDDLIEKLKLLVPNEIDNITTQNQKEILNVLVKDLNKKDKINLKADDYFLLGLSSIMNPESSIKNFEKSIELNSNNACAYFNISVLYEKMNNIIDAKKYYTKTLEVNSNYLKAYCNLSILYTKENKLKEAEKLLRHAISIDSTYVKAYLNLGNVLSLRKKYQESINVYKEAIKLNPYIGAAYSNLGLIYYNCKKYALAKENYEKAISLNSSLPEVYYNYAILLDKEEKYIDAKKAIEKVISFNKNDKVAKKLLLEIEDKIK